MFTNISWSNYLVVVSITIVIYYVFVVTLYYRTNLKDLLSGRRRKFFEPAALKRPVIENNLSTGNIQQHQTTASGETTDGDFAEAEQLAERLKTVIADASSRAIIPQEFRQYLHMILKEYPSIQTSALRPAINEMIVSECKRYGTVTLREEEVDALWKDGW